MTTGPPPNVRLIACPYDRGLRNVGLGLGASVLANDEDLRARVRAAGVAIDSRSIGGVDELAPEVARVFDVARRVAGAVGEATSAGDLPLVLAGNCNSAWGTAAGAGTDDTGVVWLDAHADFDTPDDNLSGSLDVMGLAVLTGSGWAGLWQSALGARPIPESRAILAGARDLAGYQRRRVDGSALHCVPELAEVAPLVRALERLNRETSRVYLHIDLDVLDVSAGRANEEAAPGGPTLDQLLAAVAAVFENIPVSAVALTAYDPRLDVDGRVVDAARTVCEQVARSSRRAALGPHACGERRFDEGFEQQ